MSIFYIPGYWEAPNHSDSWSWYPTCYLSLCKLAGLSLSPQHTDLGLSSSTWLNFWWAFLTWKPISFSSRTFFSWWFSHLSHLCCFLFSFCNSFLLMDMGTLADPFVFLPVLLCYPSLHLLYLFSVRLLHLYLLISLLIVLLWLYFF